MSSDNPVNNSYARAGDEITIILKTDGYLVEDVEVQSTWHDELYIRSKHQMMAICGYDSYNQNRSLYHDSDYRLKTYLYLTI